MPSPPNRQACASAALRSRRAIAHIFAVMLDQIEGVDGVCGFSPAQIIKQGQAVRSKHDGLAVDREAIGLDPPGSGRDRRQSRGPVNGVTAIQPHNRTVAADDQPIAVMLDFVNPIGTGGRFWSFNRLSGDDEPIGTGLIFIARKR